MKYGKTFAAGVAVASLALPSIGYAGMDVTGHSGSNTSVVLMLLGLVVVGIFGGFGNGAGGNMSSKSETGTGAGKVLQEF